MTNSIARMFAEFAVNLKFEDLSPEVVLSAKRFLLDSVGCALRGTRSSDCAILLRLLNQLGGTPEATIIGDGSKTNCWNAALANSLLIRVLDYNDIYWKQDPSHPSDLIPSALCVGERERKSGRDLITAIAIAYELEMRLCEFAIPGIRERKWHHASLTQFVSPVVAGKMLDLSTDQICNAIGISGCHNFTLGAVTAGRLAMTKNIVDPLAVQSGVMAALMAKEGFSGPETVFDGKEGLMDTLGGKWDVGKLTKDLEKHSKILECSMKAFPTEALTHSPITAILKLTNDYNLAPQEIEGITVKSIARAVDILADPSKYRPSSKETADHSLPYCITAAVMDRQVTLEEFTEAKLRDERILSFIDKVKVVADPELEKFFPDLKPAIVDVRCKDGRQYTIRVEYPKGDPMNPMSDEELFAKFRSNASPLVAPEKQKAIISAIMNLEDLIEIPELAELLVCDNLPAEVRVTPS